MSDPDESVLSAETRQAILQAADWAPSADNSRPWHCEWHNNTLVLKIDTASKGVGVLSDTRYLLSDLAMGALIETLRLQSRSLGLAANPNLFPDAADPARVAEMTFARSQPISSAELPLVQALPLRRTDRLVSWPRSLPARTLAGIKAEADAVAPGVALEWVGRRQKQVALRALGLAETMRFGDRRYHQELMGSIRFDAGLSVDVVSGIAPGRLGLAWPEWIGLRVLRHWPVMRVLRRLGAARTLALRSVVLPALTASALGVIVADARDRTSVVTGGRALLRSWVAANALGLGFQPFAAPAVFSMGLAPRPRASAARWARFNDAVAGLGRDRAVLMMCRISPQRRGGR